MQTCVPIEVLASFAAYSVYVEVSACLLHGHSGRTETCADESGIRPGMFNSSCKKAEDVLHGLLGGRLSLFLQGRTCFSVSFGR